MKLFEQMLGQGMWDASASEAEPMGSMGATQTPDHIIHVISCRLHYRFKLTELTQGE